MSKTAKYILAEVLGIEEHYIVNSATIRVDSALEAMKAYAEDQHGTIEKAMEFNSEQFSMAVHVAETEFEEKIQKLIDDYEDSIKRYKILGGPDNDGAHQAFQFMVMDLKKLIA